MNMRVFEISDHLISFYELFPVPAFSPTLVLTRHRFATICLGQKVATQERS
jgi:hypothetical protein